MSRFSAILICIIFIINTIGCNSKEKDYDAEKVRTVAIDKLKQGKTYLLLEGIDNAIAHYSQGGDTVHLLEMYQLASIRMRWKGERD